MRKTTIVYLVWSCSDTLILIGHALRASMHGVSAKSPRDFRSQGCATRASVRELDPAHRITTKMTSTPTHAMPTRERDVFATIVYGICE